MRIFPLMLLLSGVGLAAAPFQSDVVATGLRDPMSIAVAPDGDIYIVEREGRVLRVRPSNGGLFEIGNLPVSALRASDPKSDSAVEDGLQGIALDPDFAKNQRFFLFYSDPVELIDRLSRFQLRDGILDLASELKLIDIPVERHDRICHHGGSIQFGPDGLLYLSVGDNTNPFASDGYAPIDNRSDRKPWDAQRAAGNTNDLRGKILRVRPTETGYEIPPGNLFPPGTAKTRPEIFVMGCRNPFRISVDPRNSTLYWGEVGPDAGHASSKGPAGYDEVNQAKSAGNFGWPFVIADNKPYPIVDFATGTPGEMTDPSAPKNPGIRNTGLTQLPPAQPAFIWYSYSESQEFPAMGRSGRNAMAGPVFYHKSDRKYNLLGKQDDHTLLTYDWVRGKIWKAKLGAAEKLESLTIFGDAGKHPMDLEMADDGSLWLLDYGTEWWFNKNGSLARLLPESGNRQPEIAIAPVAGKDRVYTVKSAVDPDKDPVSIRWFLTTGATEVDLGEAATISLPVGTDGSEIRAVASDGKTPGAIARISLVKETVAPELTLKLPKNAKTYAFREAVAFEVSAANNLSAAQVTVRSRYIAATGHDAGGPQFTPEITALVTSNACLACHQLDMASVGPPYLNVSLKYRDRPDAAEHLKAKLKSGGAGVWGEVPMPPQIALNDGDSDTIIRAILGLSAGISEMKGTLAGTLQLAAKPAGAEPGGAWEFTAEAPGFTTAKFRIPAR